MSMSIEIPANFPAILKSYTKAAIRTQPGDLLLWTAAYFRCLSRGEDPPSKERLEVPIKQDTKGMTPGLLRVLHKQLGSKDRVLASKLNDMWRDLCLPKADLDHIIKEGGWRKDEIEWIKFMSIACYFLNKNNIKDTLRCLCHVLSPESDGAASMTLNEFKTIYAFLSHRYHEACPVDMKDLEPKLTTIEKHQQGLVYPKNIDLIFECE